MVRIHPVRPAHDDGATWAFSREVEAGPSAYSALARLDGGRMALLWESGSVLPYDRVRFAAFGQAWVTGP